MSRVLILIAKSEKFQYPSTLSLLILAKLDGFMLSSFSIPSTYEAEVTIVLFLINNYLDVLPQ